MKRAKPVAADHSIEWRRNPDDRAYIQEKLDWMKAHIRRTDLTGIGDPDPRFSQTNSMIAHVNAIERGIDHMLVQIQEAGSPDLLSMVRQELRNLVRNVFFLYSVKPSEIRASSQRASARAKNSEKAGTAQLLEAVVSYWMKHPSSDKKELKIKIIHDDQFMSAHGLELDKDGRSGKLEEALRQAEILGKAG